jgi:colicin import membrane protein
VVQVTIQLLPSGEVRNAQVKQSSGNAAFDDAVIRGVYATSPFPKDTNGTVPSTMDLKYSLSPLGQT